jgi:dihydroflavonol-4-reductase
MINIEVTRALLVEAAEAGVARLVYTSTLHTLATGSADNPANEDAPWNLHAVDSPYARTKREAERIVLDGLGGRLETVVLCPGMVIGPRAERPTSTRLILSMARCPVVTMPPGGIPIVDAGVLAKAHRLALCRGEPGQRYALVGPYLSYVEMARLVARVSCRPWWVRELPDQAQRPMTRLAQILERHAPSLGRHLNQATVAGGFLRLRVRGDRADEVFELIHPPPLDSIRDCLRDAWKSGQAPWLRLRPDPE